jgi:peroxiredoxin
MKTKNVLLFMSALLICACAKKSEKADQGSAVELPPAPVNDLPSMPITLLDGTTVNARDLKGKIMLVFFQPDCDHCQHEAQQMQQNLESFSTCTLYFVSSAAAQEIEKFSKDYKLDGKTNIYFGMTPGENVINSYGPIQTPSVYIYNDQKFIKEFNGQVEVGVILKYL